jgi:hypothetical protein
MDGDPTPSSSSSLLRERALTHSVHPLRMAGWLAQLQHLYARRADVIGRGFSGYNSRWALTMVGACY